MNVKVTSLAATARTSVAIFFIATEHMTGSNTTTFCRLRVGMAINRSTLCRSCGNHPRGAAPP
jgi:hypothetical protein